VITVLAGRPPAYPEVPSEWDALGGFKAGDDVVAARRLEDLAALEVLESDHRWLEFADHQYLAPADRPTPADVAPVLADAIAELDPTAVFVPMGLGNPDHVMTHEASLLVRAEQLDRAWFCYEDHGYKHIPGLLAWRVAKLLRRNPGRRRPSSRTSPTRSASAGPSSATPARSPRWRTSTRSRPAWRAASPSSSGGSPRPPRAGRAWPTSSESSPSPPAVRWRATPTGPRSGGRPSTWTRPARTTGSSPASPRRSPCCTGTGRVSRCRRGPGP
jgi:LmbE family N-acetylglucosaminyl deacetylase